MMPEIGNALLCLALGVALLLSVYPLGRSARRRANDGLRAAFCLGSVYLRDGGVPDSGQRLRG